MNAHDLIDTLKSALEYGDYDELEELRDKLTSVATYRDAGVLSGNLGLVLRFEGGDELHLTIPGSYGG